MSKLKHVQGFLTLLREFSALWATQKHVLKQGDATILQRYTEHMPEVDDLSAIVLKGHLLVEEMLTDVISSSVPNPGAIEEGRLGFYQKVSIARALSRDRPDSRVWDLIMALNTVRNDMAHALTSGKRQQRIERARELYFNIGHFDEERTRPDAEVFRSIAIFCMGYLSSCIAEAKVVSRWTEVLDKLPEQDQELSGPPDG